MAPQSTITAFSKLSETELPELIDTGVTQADCFDLNKTLDVLSPHFISLGLDPSHNLALVITMACPKEWVCYGSEHVSVEVQQVMAAGVIVRLSGGDAMGLLEFAQGLVERNRRIETRREQINKAREEAERALQKEVHQLMETTGGFELRNMSVTASSEQPQNPFIPPAVESYASAVPPLRNPLLPHASPPGVQREQVRPDLVIEFNDQPEETESAAAPSLEELMKRYG